MPLPAIIGWNVVGAFIVSMLKPIAQYLLVALGISLITYTGFTVVFDGLTSYLYSNYDNLPTNVLKILDLMGVHSAIKILLSTMTGIAAYKAAIAPTRAIWKKPGSAPSIST